MANVGHFIDRNPTLRAAGLASIMDEDNNAGACFIIAHPEEKAEQMLIAECMRQKRINAGPLFKRTPVMPLGSVRDLLTTDLTKSRFTAFKERFSEDMYFKKAKLGQVKPAFSKPESVNNMSQTFGCESTTTEPVYPIILPPKSAKQVNEEYCDFHQGHIVSHNHYFPGEQINRKYTEPFDRNGTFGNYMGVDDNGLMVKRCLKHCDHLIIVSKPQMDFLDRTYGRLGKKYKKYPYVVPDMVHGIPTVTEECDGKMLIENISPCVNNTKLIESFGHLNKWRHKLQKRPDFHMFDLQSILEKSDKDSSGFLPLERIFEVMHKMHIRVDSDKMRTCVKHFNLIVDEGCATERVNYEQFCRLLTIQLPLPTTGNISVMPANVYNKDTTYRLLCADLLKKPNESAPLKLHIPSPEEYDDVRTHVKDLICPQLDTKLGVAPSDYEKRHPRPDIERIFKNIVDAPKMELAWNVLLEKYTNQKNCFSVNQVLDAIDKVENPEPEKQTDQNNEVSANQVPNAVEIVENPEPEPTKE